MIVKIKLHKRPTFGKLLEYILNDKERLCDKSGKSFVITHNLKGQNIESWERQLKENEMNRLRKRSNSVYLSHEILSWHREDTKNISLEKMELMTREYIQLRNPKGIFVAAPHFDKEHFHIHILVSGIEYKSGKGMRLSKIALTKLKKDIQLFQQKEFPELSKSVVNHDKKQKSILGEKEYQIKFRTGRQSEKEKVIAKINEYYSKAASRENFFMLLSEHGLTTYERSGRITGVIHGKYKFRFKRLGYLEEKIDRLGIPIQRKKDMNFIRQDSHDKKRNLER